MIHVLLAALLLPLQKDADASTRFRALHEKKDAEGCAALWRENPALALPTIEADLDAALAIREKAKDADLAAAKALEDRALWGAVLAREAIDAPLIADLTAARIGWSETDRRHYRDELAVHERAKASLEKAENGVGLETAQEAVARALALGDWHGAAKAYETCAIARQALSSLDDALVTWNTARFLYRELGLAESEITCLRGALDMCFALKRASRGRELADQGTALARARKDRKVEAEFLERRAAFESTLGLAAEAEATRKEAKTLEKE